MRKRRCSIPDGEREKRIYVLRAKIYGKMLSSGKEGYMGMVAQTTKNGVTRASFS